MTEPRSRKYDKDLKQFLYLATLDEDSEKEIWKPMTVDSSKNFSASNKWVSDRIPDIPTVFPTGSVDVISDEMEAF